MNTPNLQLSETTENPKLFMVNLIKRPTGDILLTTIVHYTLESALRDIYYTVRHEQRAKWDASKENGGWEILNYQIMGKEALEVAWNKLHTVAEERQKEKKNNLLKFIIESRDEQILKANRKLLEKHEVEYIKSLWK